MRRGSSASNITCHQFCQLPALVCLVGCPAHLENLVLTLFSVIPLANSVIPVTLFHVAEVQLHKFLGFCSNIAHIVP